MARIDYDRAAATYDRGRDLPAAAFTEWRVALAEHWPTELRGPVVDVGAGSAIWVALLGGWFGAPVVGVEPSTGMRAAARHRRLPPRAWLLGGVAEKLPLRDASCAVAWLSTVVHHFRDLDAAAAELRRVLIPGAVVFIRSSFPGRHDAIPLFEYFPGARRIASSFPTIEATVGAFARAGFSAREVRRVYEARDTSPGAMVERVRAMRHADSTLAPLSDEEFTAGMAALERAASTMTTAPPAGLDLVVLAG